MKTYNLESLKRLMKYSKKLDSNFCDKTFQIFDDQIKNTLLHLKKDGTAYFSEQGKNVEGKWSADYTKQTINVFVGGMNLLLKYRYSDENIYAFSLDESYNCLILIDINNKSKLAPSTINELNAYCQFTENNIDPILKRKVEEEINKKREEMKIHIDNISNECDTYPLKKVFTISGIIIFIALSSGIYLMAKTRNFDIGLSMVILSVIIGVVLYYFFKEKRAETAVTNMKIWFKDHIDDESIEFMKNDKELKRWFIENYDFNATKIDKFPIPFT